MKKQRSLIIVLIALIALFAMAAGCFTITVPSKAPPNSTTQQQTPPTTSPTTQGDLPTITLFSASPETITVGQTTNISWNVSDATSVSIQPAIGSVGPSGNQQVSLAKTTTYTLTATNSAGDTMKTLTVTVIAAVDKPDLVVTEVTTPGSIVYYKVTNLGGASSGSTSFLYLNDAKVATDYIEPLAPGEERLESFSNYTLPMSISAHTLQEPVGGITQTLGVCVDAKSDIDETNEENNCLTITLGPEFIYDFVENAHLAIWKSSAGELTWPMVGSDTKGAAFLSRLPMEDGSTHTNTLATYPQQAQSGSIQGTYGKVHAETFVQLTRLEEITVPPGTQFTAKVGFAKGADATQGVTVYFGIIDPSGSQVTLKTLDIYYDGVIDDIQVDLSQLANKKVYFFLRVESKSNGAKDWVVWVEPKVTSKP